MAVAFLPSVCAPLPCALRRRIDQHLAPAGRSSAEAPATIGEESENWGARPQAVNVLFGFVSQPIDEVPRDLRGHSESVLVAFVWQNANDKKPGSY